MRPVTIWHTETRAPVGSRWMKIGTRHAAHASRRIITITKVPTLDDPFYEAYKGAARNQTLRFRTLHRYWRIS